MNPMIWVIDDDASIRFVFDKALGVNHIEHRLFDSGDAALEALQKEVPDVIVSDIKMPGINGIDLIKAVHSKDDTIPFIIMTAHSDLNAAIDAYDNGSFEYIPKPFDIEQAIAVIRRAAVHHVNLQKLKAQQHIANQEAVEDSIEDDDDIIGKSPAMQEVFKFIGRISKTELPVLILGESGTGRELVAVALHKHGERKDHKFVSINMSSLPKENIETELFGEEGSNNECAVKKAENGTLFINEICDMPMDAQTRLLQVLQNNNYVPVNSHAPVKCNVRVIASSSRNIEDMVNKGTFIPDLYYRLNVMNINMPALRERNNDIPMLAKHFLTVAAANAHTEPKKLTSEVLVFLCRQQWPGNVRQLKNLCKYLTVMVTGKDIQLMDLPQSILHAKDDQEKDDSSVSGHSSDSMSWQEQLRNWVDSRLKAGEHDILSEAVPEFERVMLEATLSFTGNHKQESAKLLGWGRNTLTRKIKELGIH
ncbi:MAG TPA: nitrogen regulation protein NR(I) [Succinivibrionaceae bacterium]|nr:nitrogen regulation protein NR(I) [Succinivibrionaceae bacterium]